MDVHDRLSIIDRLSRYGHAYDQGDLDALAACFTGNATFSIAGGIGGMPAVMRGREEIRARMAARREATAHAQRRHIITNVILDDDGPDRVRAASYLLLGSTEDGVLHLPVTGRYVDVLVRQGDGWAIAERTLTMDGNIA